jgi:hypothetical protein
VKLSIDGEICWWSDVRSEIDRLTRELAERETQLASIRQLLEDAEARALPDGWVAVPVNPTAEMVDIWLYTATLCPDHFLKKYRAMLSARPELPPNGLPSKESGNE